MKKSILKKFIGLAMMALPILFTNCGNIDNPLENLGTQDTRVLAAALQEGALITYVYTVSGTEYSVTFKKVGDNYVLQTPAGTRGAGKKDVTHVSCRDAELRLRVENDNLPRLEVRTDVNTAATEITRLDENYQIKTILVNGGILTEVDDALNAALNGPYVTLNFICGENSKNIIISYNDGDTWKDHMSGVSADEFFYLYQNESENVCANVPVDNSNGFENLKCRLLYDCDDHGSIDVQINDYIGNATGSEAGRYLDPDEPVKYILVPIETSAPAEFSASE